MAWKAFVCGGMIVGGLVSVGTRYGSEAVSHAISDPLDVGVTGVEETSNLAPKLKAATAPALDTLRESMPTKPSQQSSSNGDGPPPAAGPSKP